MEENRVNFDLLSEKDQKVVLEFKKFLWHYINLTNETYKGFNVNIVNGEINYDNCSLYVKNSYYFSLRSLAEQYLLMHSLDTDDYLSCLSYIKSENYFLPQVKSFVFDEKSISIQS